MARDLQITNYILASLLSRAESVPIEDIFQRADDYFKTEAKKIPEELSDVDENDVEEIYRAYPSKDPKRGASTGKSHKLKDTIRRLLKTRDKDSILKAIEDYLYDCRVHDRYLKNFATFLNNLPDDDEGDELDSLIDQNIKPRYQQ